MEARFGAGGDADEIYLTDPQNSPILLLENVLRRMQHAQEDGNFHAFAFIYFVSMRRVLESVSSLVSLTEQQGWTTSKRDVDQWIISNRIERFMTSIENIYYSADRFVDDMRMLARIASSDPKKDSDLKELHRREKSVVRNISKPTNFLKHDQVFLGGYTQAMQFSTDRDPNADCQSFPVFFFRKFEGRDLIIFNRPMDGIIPRSLTEFAWEVLVFLHDLCRTYLGYFSLKDAGGGMDASPTSIFSFYLDTVHQCTGLPIYISTHFKTPLGKRTVRVDLPPQGASSGHLGSASRPWGDLYVRAVRNIANLPPFVLSSRVHKSPMISLYDWIVAAPKQA